MGELEQHIYRVVVLVQKKDENAEDYYVEERLLLKTETRYLTDIHREFYEWLTVQVEATKDYPSEKILAAEIESFEHMGQVVNP